VLEAVRGVPLERFVAVGSLAVYGMGDQVDIDESAPFVHTGDNYNYTKIECERLLEEFARETKMPLVIIRPPYIYGPRDRQFFPRVCTPLRDGQFAYLSKGEIPFTLVHVLNLVDALLLAAEKPQAVGEAFIVTDGEAITRRELVEILCDEMGYARPKASFPRGFARTAIPVFEGLARLFHSKEPPRLNRFRYKFLAVVLTFNITKAKDVLRYRPKVLSREALRDTARWFKENHPELLPRK
jgi:nucleoside-diphosphate-sugar epimerase